MQATERSGQRVDELRQIMAGLDEPALTVESNLRTDELAERAYAAADELISALRELTMSETDEDQRREYMRTWTDAIVLSGDLRRAAGLL